ncbi:glycosyltransferase [Paraburkholderia unamae]|uniref:Glycosyl transferase family 2 n=1 Tax=Paraburkholderia unamae TaxID=219649 RepID=A0ABX5KYG6_9BURK|nr:glycosyltransferase [Paraburkholderia unamae]PVX97435.1 glycosyl transferase family 2 [Paraburkholderia unamae]CAG9274072.1 Glycosyl transferase family 2 [Paraburkholderia unamae]
MPTVSILIPAFKPTYLARTLASACAQNYADIEILVGDDTPDASLREIVEGVNDPRIRYFHHGFQDGLRNQEELWARAAGKYVKWLYDDDLLMATSVATLVAALESHPESAMAFHQRVVIDADDKVIDVPAALLQPGATALLDRAFLVENMVVSANNFVGEPSNVMLVRERVDVRAMMKYREHAFIYLTDVTMYLNMAQLGPVVIAGGYHSCFRRHATQNSGVANPWLAAGFFEWEIIVRGEAAAGTIGAASLDKARERLDEVYRFAIEQRGLLGLEPLRQSLDELGRMPPRELPESPRFLDGIAHARAVASAKKRKRVRLVCATRGSQAQFMTETALGRSLRLYGASGREDDVDIRLTINNTQGLPAIYNAAIEAAATDPAILVFIHDDVWLADFFWQARIHGAVDHFDVVGIAGNTRRVPGQPAWHSTTLAFEPDTDHLSGSLGRGRGMPCDEVKLYGPSEQACKLLDGLMLIADSETLLASGVRFDERFAFDFHDLDFCRQAELAGLRMGTWALSVIHEGGRRYGTAAWHEGYNRYLRKYGETAGPDMPLAQLDANEA